MMMLLRLACALLVHLAPASALTHSCDRNCVCDGVDLSRLKGQMYNMPEVVGPEGREGPDDWEYRISVCEPLPHEKIPMNCVTGSGKPWHAPHVVRFKRPHAMNQSEPTGDCQRVGYDVVLAQATEGGVQLVFTGEDGGKTHTVTANLNCDPQAGGQAPDSVRFAHLGSKDTEIDTYTFTWSTEAACPRDPPPPCDENCVCDGVDLSELDQSYEAPGLSYVDADGAPCEPSEEQAQEDLVGHARLTRDRAQVAEGVCENATILQDNWRGISEAAGSHDDAGLAEGWYRFEGLSGDSIPLYNPDSTGTGGCGTQKPGWLSGCSPWAHDSPASWACDTNGSYPVMGETQNATVCFSEPGYPCRTAVQVDVVNCYSTYYVWHLRTPPANTAYCTAPSGLPPPPPSPPPPAPPPAGSGYSCVSILGDAHCEVVHAPDTPQFLTQSQCEARCAASPRLAGNKYCCGLSLGSAECSGSNVTSLLVAFEQLDGSTGSVDISLAPSIGQQKSCTGEAIYLDASGQITFPHNSTAGDCLRSVDTSGGGGRIPFVNYMNSTDTLSWTYGDGAPMVLRAGACTAPPAPPPGPPAVCTKKLDGWAYKVSICHPLTPTELPAGCDDVQSWGAHVAQFPGNESTYTRSGCRPVGLALTEATRNEHGVLLKWEDSQHGSAGERTTVTGNLVCDEDGVGVIPRMELEAVRSDLTAISFSWNTEAACHDLPPPPPPPAYTPDLCVASADTCMCDGTDVTKLKGTVTLADANSTSQWVYKLGICGPVARAGLPEYCLDKIPANATALRYETQPDHPGTTEQPRCEQLGGGTVKATHTENADGTRDGVDIIYTFASASCDGGCEVNLRVQCSTSDAADTKPEKMIQLDVGDLGKDHGSEYFARWVATCVEEAPAPAESHLTAILCAVAAIVAVAVVAVVVVKRRRAARGGGDLDQPILDSEIDARDDGSEPKTSW